jgi:catechol 2,3-dioxygenase-like lactoylglutathione lyase family enzyme
VYDGFAWGIEPWDTNKVGDELKKRGLNPVLVKQAGGYEGWFFKDPDNFTVGVTNGTRANRRKTPANAKLPAPAPFEPTGFNTLYLDHISFEVPDYRRSAAFYEALLGWKGRGGNGQTTVDIGAGGLAGGAIIRGNAAARAAAARARGDTGRASIAPPPPANGVTAAIGHISFGIENWNTERVRAELKKRDVCYTNAQGEREPRPDMTGTLESFHVPDAMGWDLQIGNKIKPSAQSGG